MSVGAVWYNTSMQKVSVKIKLFDTNLPVPAYQTPGAAAFDLYSRVEATIAPGETKAVPTGVAVQLPADFWLLVSARSSLFKRGLQLINGVGVIDADYCGNDDEIMVLLHNFSQETAQIKSGERLAQAVVMPRIQAIFEPVETLECANRGGFGTTGAM